MMSTRSRAAYYSQLERVYSRCEAGCGRIGARYSPLDGKRLCKHCREELRKQSKTESKNT